MAKKFGKVLLFTAAIGSAVGAVYYFLKKKDAAQDAEEEDYDDFDEDKDTACSQSGNYVPLNPEPKTEDAESKDSTGFTPLAEHVAQAAEKAEETVEEFFDEEDSSSEELPIQDN